MEMTLDKPSFKIKYFFFKAMLGAMRLFRINFFNLYDHYLRDVRVKGDQSRKEFFFSSIPDRYSDNFHVYGQRTNFLEHNDLHAWLRGNYKNNIGDLTRYYFLNLCLDYLIDEDVVGDVAELGVYKGNSAYLLAKYARRVNRECILFDTYEGFDERDIKGKDAQVKKTAFDDTSLGYVKENVGEDRVTYVKGYFPDSLVQINEDRSYALVHIDCDLEKPIEDALRYFYPRLVPGGFLIMHDHSSLYWPGAEAAINDFFRDKAEKPVPIPDKSGTCVIRKAKI